MVECGCTQAGSSDDRARSVFFNENMKMEGMLGTVDGVSAVWADDLSPVGDGSGRDLSSNCFLED
jgi:hypothetical protein